MMKQFLYFLSKSVNKTFNTSGVFELLFSFIKQLNAVHKSQCDLGKLVYFLDFILANVFLKETLTTCTDKQKHKLTSQTPWRNKFEQEQKLPVFIIFHFKYTTVLS